MNERTYWYGIAALGTLLGVAIALDILTTAYGIQYLNGQEANPAMALVVISTPLHMVVKGTFILFLAWTFAQISDTSKMVGIITLVLVTSTILAAGLCNLMGILWVS